MADEDEIDVLGDFSLDNLLSKNESGISSCFDTTQNSDLLSCDYSLLPQWLPDNPTTNSDCWYTSSDHGFNTEDANSETNTSLGFDEVICSENKTTDESGWTEEEKTSLLKGLEIFGRNPVHLSQFIGSKTSSQVKHYLKHYYTKTAIHNSFSNVYNTVDINNKQTQGAKNPSNSGGEFPSVFKMADIIEDAQIPASIEEVIAAVSTAKPTVQNICKKSTTVKKKITSKHNLMRKMKFGHTLFTLQRKTLNRQRSPTRNQKHIERKKLKVERIVSKTKIDQNDISSKIKLEPSPPVIMPVSSCEEVIKIKKENSESESDTEIDIDIDEDDRDIPKIQEEIPEIKEKVEEKKNSVNEEMIPQDTVIESTSTDNGFVENPRDVISRRFKNTDDALLNVLTSLDVPTDECLLDTNTITDLEKCVHSEFFEGRPTKTPSRYLKIRNHIIDYWLENKPMYCTKTSVRHGLKNCGDVNCIGRVHQYLEQIGAINFGCDQINYIRPLINMFTATPPTKEKSIPVQPQKSETMRPRMKKKYNNDGEGGYTMMHDENGEIIDTTVVNQDKQVKPRTNRRQNIKLVYCKGFSDENPAPYTIELHITALLLIDIHAHSALIEVMGLLGGVFDQGRRMLHITRYVPCRGTDHSNTHCDMCPVSQSEASEVLQTEGVEVVGWFHSHPTFYPNPSLQDIDTQLNMQLYLSNEYKPFVGVILSPFRAITNTPASEYRCLIVDKNESSKDGTSVPYKFQINLTSTGLNVDSFLKHARNMFSMENNIPKEFLVDFQKPYFHDTSMNHLEKLLASIKLHLARCTEINKMTCDSIVEGVTDICLSNST
ncbi:uncharacterized protein CBL_00446 [Carabus blaptoides fortunei]